MSDDYLDPYREAVDRFGATFDATLWNSREFQRLRFEVLRGMVDLNGLTLLDAGCGLGDLCEHLRERNVQLARYVGVDGVPEIVEAAKRRQLPHAEFHCRDFVADADALRLGRPDVIFFSGSLNTLPEETARLAAQRGAASSSTSSPTGLRPPGARATLVRRAASTPSTGSTGRWA